MSLLQFISQVQRAGHPGSPRYTPVFLGLRGLVW